RGRAVVRLAAGPGARPAAPGGGPHRRRARGPRHEPARPRRLLGPDAPLRRRAAAVRPGPVRRDHRPTRPRRDDHGADQAGLRSRQSSSGLLTIRNGLSARRSAPSATEPNIQRLKLRRPCVPITTQSWSLLASTIAFTGSPSSTILVVADT